MARILAAFPSALIAAREGMSANAFYRQLQSLGMGARRSEVLALYRASKSILSLSPEEPFRDIRQVPVGNEIGVWPTRKATGYSQTVAMTFRNKITGEIILRHSSVSSEQPMVRETAMAHVLRVWTAGEQSLEMQLIGAVHVSTRHKVPMTGA